jgi:hypothetical protein
VYSGVNTFSDPKQFTKAVKFLDQVRTCTDADQFQALFSSLQSYSVNPSAPVDMVHQATKLLHPHAHLVAKLWQRFGDGDSKEYFDGRHGPQQEFDLDDTRSLFTGKEVRKGKDDSVAWVECSKCTKWRRLASGMQKWMGEFSCDTNTWDQRFDSCTKPLEDFENWEEYHLGKQIHCEQTRGWRTGHIIKHTHSGDGIDEYEVQFEDGEIEKMDEQRVDDLLAAEELHGGGRKRSSCASSRAVEPSRAAENSRLRTKKDRAHERDNRASQKVNARTKSNTGDARGKKKKQTEAEDDQSRKKKRIGAHQQNNDDRKKEKEPEGEEGEGSILRLDKYVPRGTRSRPGGLDTGDFVIPPEFQILPTARRRKRRRVQVSSNHQASVPEFCGVSASNRDEQSALETSLGSVVWEPSAANIKQSEEMNQRLDEGSKRTADHVLHALHALHRHDYDIQAAVSDVREHPLVESENLTQDQRAGLENVVRKEGANFEQVKQALPGVPRHVLVEYYYGRYTEQEQAHLLEDPAADPGSPLKAGEQQWMADSVGDSDLSAQPDGQANARSPTDEDAELVAQAVLGLVADADQSH